MSNKKGSMPKSINGVRSNNINNNTVMDNPIVELEK
jgi:hypothetical protein